MRDYLVNMGILGVVGGGISESGIVWIVGALAALPTLLFCANQAKQFFSRTPPLHAEFRTAAQCDERCQTANERHAALAANTETRLRAMAEKSGASREKIYIRLAALESALSAMKKEDEMQTQRLMELSSKIDRLIERSKL